MNNTVNSIQAHKGGISAISLNEDSSIVATSSEKGTLIRIWNTKDGAKLREVWRGADNA